MSFGYDRFTVDYLTRVKQGSGTSITYSPAAEIGEFIKGLNGLGFWTTLIEASTSISEQNAGTGTVVYGLKGGSNGTLVNGPTWGVNGITLTGGSSHQITGLPQLAASPISVLVVGNFLWSASGYFGLGGIADGTRNFGVYSNESGFNDRRQFAYSALDGGYILGGPDSQVSAGVFHSVGTAVTGATTGNIFYDSTTTVGDNSGQNWNTSTGSVTSTFAAVNGITVELASILFFAGDITSIYSQIYALYKNTIGKGLGLP